MSRSTKQSWLEGPGDLEEADVEDVPVKGESVRVRGLPAAYSNQASSEAMEMVTGRRGEQIARVNTGRLEVLQFVHGVIEPKFEIPDAEVIATKYGPAFRKVIAEIDRLSGLDKESFEKAEARFPAGGPSENGQDVGDGTPAGSGGPTVPARAGA